jgi:hypothetical protein
MLNHSTGKTTLWLFYHLSFLVFFLLLPFLAECHDLTPRQIVKRLYGLKENAVISSLQPDDFNPWLGRIAWSKEEYKPAHLRYYYHPEIAEYLISSNNTKPNFCIDFGVLVDGNDHVIDDFQLSTVSQTKDRMILLASFTNFKRPTSVRLSFILTNQGWQIEDIRLTDFSLRERIKECSAKGI